MQPNSQQPATIATVWRSGGDAWATTLSSAFVELDFQRLEAPGHPLRGSIHQYPFGDLTFQRSITSGQAHRVTRSERLIEGSAHDNFFVGLLLSGRATCSQAGRTAALGPGDIALLDSRRVYTIDVPQSFDALWIRTPRYRLETRVRDASNMMAARIDGQSASGCVVSEFLRAAFAQAPRLSAAEAKQVANTFLDLLFVALAPCWRRSDRRPSAHTSALLRRIKQFIEPRLGDENLCPAAIARANRMSIRYVNKLFELEGCTLASWIRNRRLERSRIDLENPSSPVRRVADIAYAHGFKNVSHFNRLFKARFGCSPKAFRQHT